MIFAKPAAPMKQKMIWRNMGNKFIIWRGLSVLALPLLHLIGSHTCHVYRFSLHYVMEAFQLPLPSDPPNGFSYSDRAISEISTRTAFDTGIMRRDIFHEKRRCVECGVESLIGLQFRHIIPQCDRETAFVRLTFIYEFILVGNTQRA